jgi:hypothetical protein
MSRTGSSGSVSGWSTKTSLRPRLLYRARQAQQAAASGGQPERCGFVPTSAPGAAARRAAPPVSTRIRAHATVASLARLCVSPLAKSSRPACRARNIRRPRLPSRSFILDRVRRSESALPGSKQRRVLHLDVPPGLGEGIARQDWPERGIQFSAYIPCRDTNAVPSAYPSHRTTTVIVDVPWAHAAIRARSFSTSAINPITLSTIRRCSSGGGTGIGCRSIAFLLTSRNVTDGAIASISGAQYRSQQ